MHAFMVLPQCRLPYLAQAECRDRQALVSRQEERDALGPLGNAGIAHQVYS